MQVFGKPQLEFAVNRSFNIFGTQIFEKKISGSRIALTHHSPSLVALIIT